MALQAGVMGAAGFAGVELVRLLATHPAFDVKVITSDAEAGSALSDTYPAFYGVDVPPFTKHDDPALLDCDLVFLAVPHTAAMKYAPRLLQAGVTVIDLSADYRLADPQAYEQWYATPHTSPELLETRAFGLPELFRKDILGKRVIANPGCYTTGAPLALAPAVANGLIELTGIIIDSKSGVTGAGRGLSQGTHYPDLNEGLHAYKVASHRHTPEIEQTLSRLSGQKVHVTFVPHLLPVNRGILSTCYGRLKPDVTKAQVRKAYEDFYQDEYFVRLLPDGMNADIHNIKYSNFCDISLHIDTRCGNLIAISAIDNMVKGAAGQAIQNMNLIFGLEEASGLALVPPAF